MDADPAQDDWFDHCLRYFLIAIARDLQDRCAGDDTTEAERRLAWVGFGAVVDLIDA